MVFRADSCRHQGRSVSGSIFAPYPTPNKRFVMLKRIKTEIGDLAFAIGLLCLILVVLTALVMAPSFIWNFISSYRGGAAFVTRMDRQS